MKCKTILAASALVMALSPAIATAGKGVEVGVMTCHIEDTSNVIVYSNAKYSCTLQSSNNKLSNGLYEAKIKRIGLNFEWKSQEKLVWGVFALTNDIENGPIAGTYIGAGADAALGIGGGANALVGGVNKSFALQPLSLSGAKGIGASVGVEEMTLHYKGAVSN